MKQSASKTDSLLRATPKPRPITGQSRLDGAPAAKSHAIALGLTTEAMGLPHEAMALLLANLPGMAYWRGADPAHTLLFASEGSRTLLGFSPSELTRAENAPLATRIHADDRDATLRHIETALADRTPFQIVYYAITKDGRGKWVQDQGHGIYDADGALYGVMGFASDATERKQAEDALMEARLVADAANRTKSEFLTTIAQEIRTPLTSILGFASMIDLKLRNVVFPALHTDDPRVTHATEKLTRNVGIIMQECDRLASLLSSVLDVAALDAGRVIWKSEQVDLAEAIRAAATVMTPLVEQKGLALRLHVNRDLPLLAADKDRLVQVMQNLIANAVRFTDKGGIDCTALRRGNDILVTVADSGAGIAPENMDRIFEPFIQVGDTLAAKPRGTGLGLPICKQIIEHHGGRIWVEHNPGGGSTFAFTLPVGAP
ncbi:MAG: ATP-binding protein [Desulfovibrionaceae bacterium]